MCLHTPWHEGVGSWKLFAFTLYRYRLFQLDICTFFTFLMRKIKNFFFPSCIGCVEVVEMGSSRTTDPRVNHIEQRTRTEPEPWSSWRRCRGLVFIWHHDVIWWPQKKNCGMLPLSDRDQSFERFVDFWGNWRMFRRLEDFSECSSWRRLGVLNRFTEAGWPDARTRTLGGNTLRRQIAAGRLLFIRQTI